MDRIIIVVSSRNVICWFQLLRHEDLLLVFYHVCLVLDCWSDKSKQLKDITLGSEKLSFLLDVS